MAPGFFATLTPDQLKAIGSKGGMARKAAGAPYWLNSERAKAAAAKRWAKYREKQFLLANKPPPV